MSSKTRRKFDTTQICPRCLSVIADEYVTKTPDGPIHEACEALPRPSRQQRQRWTLAARSATALTKNKRRLW